MFEDIFKKEVLKDLQEEQEKLLERWNIMDPEAEDLYA